MSEGPWLALVESNTTGSGRQFCIAARAQQLRPVVLTSESRRYPYLERDRVDLIVLDTEDRRSVLDACRQLAKSDLAGVTSSSEYYVATAAAAAAALRLPGPSVDAIEACRQKDRQRDRLARAGVAGPRYRVARTTAQAIAAVTDTGLPAVVKPTTGSGSIGVRLCRTKAEVAQHSAALLAVRVNERGTPMASQVLVEEYLTGPEFSVEALAGQVIGITRKHLGPTPYFVEVGHDFPAPVSDADGAALAGTAVAAVAALDLGFGATHTELRLAPGGPVVVEVNPRLAGGMIPALVQEATGIDLVSCCVALATGRSPSCTPTKSAASAIRFVMAPRAGQVTRIVGLDEARSLDGCGAVALSVNVGDVIPPLENSFRDRLGYVLGRGEDLIAAMASADEALAGVSVVVEPE